MYVKVKTYLTNVSPPYNAICQRLYILAVSPPPSAWWVTTHTSTLINYGSLDL